jgi:hypothetical protein
MSLWIPILVSAVLAFIASSVIHMALGYHKSDFVKVPAQDDVMSALRSFHIPPGDYMMPCPDSMADMKSPAFIERRDKGPNLVMTVMPNGPYAMGSSMAKWFVYLIVVNLFGAYIAGHALPPGAQYLEVFRIIGATTFMGYALALWQDSIWYHRKMGTTIRNTIDGLIYALLAGGVFGWLWPR